jgi:hypothetical protein
LLRYIAQQAADALMMHSMHLLLLLFQLLVVFAAALPYPINFDEVRDPELEAQVAKARRLTTIHQDAVPHRPAASAELLKHPDAQLPRRQPNARRTVIGGHGVVIMPGSAPVQVDGQETTRITVGGSSYQVAAGVDTVIDGVPVEEYTPVGGGSEVDEPAEIVSAGKAAAIMFAEAAERIQREMGQGVR